MISSIASNALRLASRRVVSRAAATAQKGRVGFASAAVEANANQARNKAMLAATAGLVTAVAVLEQRKEEESTKCFFFGKSAAQAVKETEEKFGSYWPRNILILL